MKNILFFRTLFPVLLPMLVALLLGYGVYIHFEIQREHARAKADIENRLQLAAQVFGDAITATISDLQLIASEAENQFVPNGSTPINESLLANMIVALVDQRKNYLQIRYIDTAGKERFSVKRKNGKSEVVTGNQLQYKGQRPYFKASHALGRGEIHISPMEPNMEHGQIAQNVPMVVRLGTPIFSGTGDKHGVIVINALATKYFEKLTLPLGGKFTEIWVFDERSGKQVQLNNMEIWELNESAKGDFKVLFPYDWQQSGGVYFAGVPNEGPFAYVALRNTAKMPMLGSMAALNGPIKLIIKVPKEVFSVSRVYTIMRILPILILALFLVITASWFVAFYRARQLAITNVLDEAAKRETMIVELGQAALVHHEVDVFWGLVVEKLSSALDAKSCYIFEYLPEQKQLCLCAGVGCPPDLAGTMQLDKNDMAYVEHIMQSDKVVLVEDFQSEQYFHTPSLLCDKTLKSGITVVVPGVSGKFGFLGVFSSEKGWFSEHDISFLQSMVGLFSQVLLRNHFEHRTQLLYKAMDAAADGIAIADKEGFIHWTNPAYKVLASCSFEELRTTIQQKINNNSQLSQLDGSLWDTVNEGNIWCGELEHQTNSGETVYEEESISPILDCSGEVTHFVSIKRDITQRKNSEEKIRLQATALNSAVDAMVITDTDAKVKWANPAYTKLTGYQLDEVLTKNTRMLKSGKHGKQFYHDMWQTILAGKVWHGEIYNKRKDNTIYLEDQTITPVTDKNGVVRNFIAIKRDITAQYELQKQLQQAQKMEAIGQLTGGVAHDFNNMLAVILGYAGLACEQLSLNGDEMILDYLQEVKCSAERARDLVAQMLAFTRNDEINLCEMSIAPILSETLKMLQHTLPSSIQLSPNLKEVGKIVADPVKINQIIMNLCINARDAMSGKGVLTITLREVQTTKLICQSCHKTISGDFVCLTIRDTGAGIPPEQINKVFEPFFTTKEVGKGTGMGLSMVHGLMHQFGGHICIATTGMLGAEFTLLFPLAKAADSTDEGLIVNQPKTETFQKIDLSLLVVDDEVAIGKFIAELLGGLGCKTTLAENGEQALSLIQQDSKRFDLLITDQTMPQMNGIELARAVRGIRKDLPIILCTGYSADLEMEELEALDISFLTKPIDNLQLKRMVVNCVTNFDSDNMGMIG